ncbi:MAG: hypothetical protein H6713_17525 [Myxococcales bacterium]|nr:hypothetical protein [Myxococcales bacterium]MCB9751777.1 hypothetical protein [Myxococcales bacterium]
MARKLAPGESRAVFGRSWWKTISDQELPTSAFPRSIANIVKAGNHTPVLVVASPDYILAMEDDLLAARDVMRSSEQLIVISNGPRLKSSRIINNVIPVDERARSCVSGSLQGLNARVAHKLVRGIKVGPICYSKLRERYDVMMKDAKKPARTHGETMTDDQVIEYIHAELEVDSNVKQTRLLQKLRKSGRSCEQKRFRGLFIIVKKG